MGVQASAWAPIHWSEMDSRPVFEDIDDPRPRAKEPPTVLVGPRGQVHEIPGIRSARTTLGGDTIASYREGELVVPRRHRQGSYEIDDNGEQQLIGWVAYREMCADPEVYMRHGLTREQSMDFYDRHMRLLTIRDKGNDISKAVGDCTDIYHPEILRRRQIPVESGRMMTAEQLAAELGLEPTELKKPESANDIVAEAKASKKSRKSAG